MKPIRKLENQVALIVGGGQIPGDTIGNVYSCHTRYLYKITIK